MTGTTISNPSTNGPTTTDSNIPPVDAHDRATALEVWLFDKSDIRTVTKVLMSDYAYGNPPLREKPPSRGDAVFLGTGIGFVLDAQTLRLAGKVWTWNTIRPAHRPAAPFVT